MLRISNPSRLKVNNINLFQIIITIHRRENFAKIHELLKTIIMTANLFPDLYFTFVVHPNPVIAKSIKKVSIPPKNLKFVAPMEYIDFIEILNSSRLVITDSGGLQEECMTLGIPTLVFRETTERPEGLSPDHVQLWDGSFEILKNKILKLKESELILKKYSDLNRYFGNGKSAAAIIKIVEEYFHVQ
jgi:UDP-N-acetylglucosamine 2-epimerase (non-hydrolysing)